MFTQLPTPTLRSFAASSVGFSCLSDGSPCSPRAPPLPRVVNTWKGPSDWTVCQWRVGASFFLPSVFRSLPNPATRWVVAKAGAEPKALTRVVVAGSVGALRVVRECAA